MEDKTEVNENVHKGMVDTSKTVTIAEPETISSTLEASEDAHANNSQSQNPKQYRASGARRLTGRPSIDPLPSSPGLVNSTKNLTMGTEEDKSTRSKDSQSHDPHSQLLSQVTEWLHAEKTRLTRKPQLSHKLSKPHSRDGQHDEDSAKQTVSASSDTELALETLEKILKDNMAVAQNLFKSPNKDNSYFGRRKSSSKRMRKASIIGASSDTEYNEGDAVVPTTDVVLDNSKTMSYSGGAADSDMEVSSTKAKAKEKEGWLLFKSEVIRLAHTLRLKGWRRVPLDQGRDIEIQRLSGALTNAVYVVSPPKDLPNTPAGDSSVSLTPRKPPSKLLLRVYGPQVDHLIDRESELQILRRLARKRIGPRLLGTFKNGRFEEFLNAKTLTPEDLRNAETSKQIAKRMRELHEGIDLLDEERNAGPFVWQNWDKWVARCEEVISWLDSQILAHKGAVKSKAEMWKARGLVCGVEWQRFRKAVDNYRKWLDEQYGGKRGTRQQLVFAHNDTQYGNLLRLEPSGESPLLLPANEHKQLVVIDFEYANANTPGLEFANHFTEWCYNYHSATAPEACNTIAYPSPEEQQRFLKTYVQHKPQSNISASNTVSSEPSPGMVKSTSSINAFMLDSRGPPTQYADEEKAREEGAQKEVERLMHETRIWRVANSAQWVAWGIVQAKVPGMDEALEKMREKRKKRGKGREMGRSIVDRIVGHGGKKNGRAQTESEDNARIEGGKQEETTASDVPGTEDELAASSAPEGMEEVDEGLAERPHVPHEHEIDDDAEFDYLAYAQDRALFFWGDMLELGLVQEGELPSNVVTSAKRIGY